MKGVSTRSVNEDLRIQEREVGGKNKREGAVKLVVGQGRSSLT